MDLNVWLVKSFGETKAKWIKSVIGGALILIIGYWTAPLTTYINGLSWATVYTTAMIQTFNIGMVVLIAFIILFFGKPTFIIDTTVIDDSLPEEELAPEPKIEPDKPIEPIV